MRQCSPSGRRVFINCPTDPRRGVVLTDDAGRSMSRRLADGVEVEIVAWRPRGRSHTRYRVHSIRDQSEGWLGADDLCSLQRVPPTAPGSGREDTARKFGQGR